MIDERDLLERALHRFEPQPGLADRVYRRRQQKRRKQRIGAGALAIILALVSFVALARAFRTAERPADEPTPRPQGIFSEVGGWIAYGNDEGIWAVNPTPVGSPSDRVQLSERPGEPLAWSSDGSKLLILREVSDATRDPAADLDLFVLNADGTETRLTWDRGWPTGSFSPDGSEVIYAATTQRGNEEPQSGIYVVEADGGSRRLVLAGGQRKYPDGTFETGLGSPTFSPDETQIAYFDGMGDWGNTLRVMNADGSGVRVVIDQEFSHYDNLAWSSDGSRLVFNGTGGGIWIVGVDGSGLTEVPGLAPRWSPTGSRLAFQPVPAGGISVINADGSGLRQVTPVGHDPVWSPDGSRIAYQYGGSLYAADLDGTHVRTLGTLESRRRPIRPTRVAWNPLPLSASGGEQPAATEGGSGAAPFVYAIAVLGAVGVLVIVWRARRRTAAT